MKRTHCYIIILSIVFHTNLLNAQVYDCLFKSSSVLKEPYGVCTHINTPGIKDEFDTRIQDLNMIKSVGASFFRTSLSWPRLINNNKSYDFDHFNQMMKTVDCSSLKMLSIVTLHGKFKMTQINDWVEYISNVCSVYNQIKYWELINEVDLVRNWTPDIYAVDYITLLKIGYQTVKRINRKNKVLFSGISNSDSQYLDSVLCQNVSEYFDIMNVHRYNHKKDEPESLLDYYKQLEKKLTKYNVAKPVWMTECGCSTAEGWTTEETQSMRLPRIFLISFACGVDKVFWYKSRSREMNPEDPEDYFGLWHKDYTPKPAYYAYRTLTRMCPDKSVRPALCRQENVYIAQWRRPDGKRAYGLWTSTGKETVRFSTKGNYNCYDINGREVSVSGNQIEISPSILYFVGGRKFEMSIKESL